MGKQGLDCWATTFVRRGLRIKIGMNHDNDSCNLVQLACIGLRTDVLGGAATRFLLRVTGADTSQALYHFACDKVTDRACTQDH